ncbi:GNAT family N-acetyltransferase [Sporanaerobium hydrogeniformans]|uniref:GNAT family N-acetyltransferase n=1 Tax=Sporanaerobium hydrogeniformans TaxID=3072179 RepID=A0AC61DB87_9FIRM|nr:GNAT family protein [Sporanaerobium hydrogeniformans]PHV70015.1 GNAT family N-acetyltransferase [Sporanaerobium hydrogeniformans]
MLRLRPFKMSDATYLANWIQDERSFNMWSANKLKYPLSEEQIKGYKEMYEIDEFGWIFTALNEKGTPVGHFLMRMADYKKESVHFGFIIVDPSLRGKGYGVEMVSLGVHYAFEILKVRRVTLGVFDTNPAAEACYKKVGFVTETYNKGVFNYKDEKWGIFNMAIQREKS